MATSVQRGSLEVPGRVESRGPHSGLQALQQRSEEPEDPYSVPGTTSSAPCRVRALTWGRRSTFRARRAHQPGRAAHWPSAVQTTIAPPRSARSPRIPLPKLFRPPSLARCPLPALELAVPGIAVRLLQAPGLPPRTSGHRETGNSATKERESAAPLDSPACPGSRAPAPIRDAPLTAAPQPAGAPGVPGDLARPGSMHSPPGSPAALARAPARAAPLSGLGSGQPDSPLRSPPAPSALCCAGAPSCSNTSFLNS